MGTDQFITDKPQTVQHFGLNIGRVHPSVHRVYSAGLPGHFAMSTCPLRGGPYAKFRGNEV